MIYKYTKCESVIAKIMADSNMSEKNIRITDIKEWIFEAMEKIGAPVQYEQRESGTNGDEILKVEEYQVPIPDDLERLDAVAYSDNPHGPWVPVRKDESTFREHAKTHINDKVFVDNLIKDTNMALIGKDNMIYETVTDKETGGYHVKPIKSISEIPGRINHEKMLAKYLSWKGTFEPTYFVKPGWVVLNKPKGYVKLSYKAIATDERGYPLIPDLASYQEAIYWYVMMKLNFPKFLSGTLGGRVSQNANIYSYLQRQWNFYRNQAYAEAMMPNEGEMRTIKNEWTKLIPDWDSDDRFFKSNGQRQVSYNDYYYGY